MAHGKNAKKYGHSDQELWGRSPIGAETKTPAAKRNDRRAARFETRRELRQIQVQGDKAWDKYPPPIY